MTRTPTGRHLHPTNGALRRRSPFRARRGMLAGVLALLIACSAPSPCQEFTAFILRLRTAPERLRPALVDSFLAAHTSFPLIEGDTLCHFIHVGNADRVTVPGDANGWNASAFPMTRIASTNLWYCSHTFAPDERLDYKLAVDSIWMPDPRNPRQVRGGFGPNSELRMPRFIPSLDPIPVPETPRGSLLDTTILSIRLGNPRRILIWLPPGWSGSLPPHALALFHDGPDYLDLASAATVLDNLTAQKSIRPTIAVFVAPVDRDEEYAGTRIDACASFIVDELLPWLESRYHLSPHATDRVTIGASNGGNIALYLATMHPEAFGGAGAQSPNVIDTISASLARGAAPDIRVHLTIGTHDIDVLIPMVRSLHAILQRRGGGILYREPRDGHSWGNWRQHLGDILRWLLPSTPPRIENR